MLFSIDMCVSRTKLWKYLADSSNYCTISFNSAGIVTRDGPTEILVSADAQSGRDTAKNFGSLPPEAAKNCAYRSVTGKKFGSPP